MTIYDKEANKQKCYRWRERNPEKYREYQREYKRKLRSDPEYLMKECWKAFLKGNKLSEKELSLETYEKNIYSPKKAFSLESLVK